MIFKKAQLLLITLTVSMYIKRRVEDIQNGSLSLLVIRER